MIIYLYVDDMLIVSVTVKRVEDSKKYLYSKLKMKDLGKVDTILGIKVRKYSGDYFSCQSHYIDKILTKFQYLKVKEELISLNLE